MNSQRFYTTSAHCHSEIHVLRFYISLWLFISSFVMKKVVLNKKRMPNRSFFNTASRHLDPNVFSRCGKN